MADNRYKVRDDVERQEGITYCKLEQDPWQLWGARIFHHKRIDLKVMPQVSSGRFNSVKHIPAISELSSRHVLEISSQRQNHCLRVC